MTRHGTPAGGRLQDAVYGSAKDILRTPLTLNSYKQRLLRNNDVIRSKIGKRFQDPLNNPYQEKLLAAAILNRSHYDVRVLSSNHPHKDNLIMFVRTGTACTKGPQIKPSIKSYKQRLRITQAKAKMYEYNVDERHHIAIYEHTKDLFPFNNWISGECCCKARF